MSGTNPSEDVQTGVKVQFRLLMVSREGKRTDVYKDTRGLPTVGIGHLVRPVDNLRLGDVISEDRVNALFDADCAGSLAAAWAQAAAAGITSVAFIPYLASVNFQLGTGWTREFLQTWQMIVDGRYDDARSALSNSLWNQQTPVRVADFQQALGALPPKSIA